MPASDTPHPAEHKRHSCHHGGKAFLAEFVNGNSSTQLLTTVNGQSELRVPSALGGMYLKKMDLESVQVQP